MDVAKLGGEGEEQDVAREEGEGGRQTGGGDSNRASEEEQEEEEDDPKVIESTEEGSIKFGGPQNDRQRAVVGAFQHAWQGYRTYSWGKDHLKPISKTHLTWFNLGLTLIDSLDTMIVMNLKQEFKEAQGWVQESLNFDINKDVNLFETTIRVLGGLLSAFHLSQEKLYLEKAVDLAGEACDLYPSPAPTPTPNPSASAPAPAPAHASTPAPQTAY